MTSNILLVDDNPGMIQVMARSLSGQGQLRFATSGTAALRHMRDQPPDLVLLDAEMPGLSGYQVCEAMKGDPLLADIPVIIVTGHSGPESELKSLDIGAADFIAKPISEPLLVARVKTQLRVKALTDELRRIATTDALTEVANRRCFNDTLAREWRRGLRAVDPICMLMIDVDHFKAFNDLYGHPAGDVCLRSVAQALRGAVMRPADLVARYGGEEFALLLPQTPREGAEHMARRVLGLVADLGVPHEAARAARHVTVSVGVACFDSTEWGLGPDRQPMLTDDALPCDFNALVLAADQALYAAKRAGRAQAWLARMTPDGTATEPQAVAKTM